MSKASVKEHKSPYQLRREELGLTREEAETAAKEAKIKLEIVEETSKTVEAGYIVKQETESDTEVNAGDTVKVYISIGTGIEQVVVTSVLYKDEATAKQTLEGIGLVVEVEYAEDNESLCRLGKDLQPGQNIYKSPSEEQGQVCLQAHPRRNLYQ